MNLCPVTRWLEETGGTRGAAYEEHFRRLEEQGDDVHGEARAVAALLAPGARVLDAGCGTGRVARQLARLGHDVVGADNDASMLAAARAAAPELRWVDADLATLDLGERFDAVVLAGNVVVYVAPGTEGEVLARCAAHLVPGGLLVSGWRTDLLPRADYEALVADLEPVARWSTWDGEPWRDDADLCVAVDRLPR